MTSLFSAESIPFEPAESVSINEIKSGFAEDSLQPLFGKEQIGGKKAIDLAREQARQAVFLRHVSEMSIQNFQEVPQEDGDIWLVGMHTIDGVQHHVHISQNDLLNSITLVEATAAEVESRKQKHKITADKLIVDIDNKHYFVDFNIPFNFGLNGETKLLINIGVGFVGSFLAGTVLQEILGFVGGKAFKKVLKEATNRTLKLVFSVIWGAIKASYQFLKALFSGLFSGQFSGLIGRASSAAGNAWRGAIVIEEGALAAAGYAALLAVAAMLIMYMVVHDTRHSVTIYNLTAKDLLISTPYMGHGETDTIKDMVVKACDNRGRFGKWYNAVPIKSASKSVVSGIGIALNLSLCDPGTKNTNANFSCMFDIPFIGTNSLDVTAVKQDNIEQYYGSHEGLNTSLQASAFTEDYEIIVTYDILSGKQYDADMKSDGYIYNSLVIVREKIAA